MKMMSALKGLARPPSRSPGRLALAAAIEAAERAKNAMQDARANVDRVGRAITGAEGRLASAREDVAAARARHIELLLADMPAELPASRQALREASDRELAAADDIALLKQQQVALDFARERGDQDFVEASRHVSLRVDEMIAADAPEAFAAARELNEHGTDDRLNFNEVMARKRTLRERWGKARALLFTDPDAPIPTAEAV